jgi:glutathione S-transferase
MGRFTDRITSRIASALRMGAGARVVDLGPRPAQPLTLYEFESCPFCRRVREALTELDLVAHILPCPKGGQRYRPELIERGGKELFPYLVDPNAGVEMYESRFIVRHLYERYGAGSPPFKGGALEIASGSAASAMRLPGAGVRARSSTRPEQPLVLYPSQRRGGQPVATRVRGIVADVRGSLAFRSEYGSRERRRRAGPRLSSRDLGRVTTRTAAIQRRGPAPLIASLAWASYCLKFA